jgi:hypothetical protein
LGVPQFQAHPNIILLAGWWFQSFFIFYNIWIWDNPSHWLILFKMVIAPPTSEDKYFLVIPNIFLWCEKLGDKTLGPVQWLDDDRENRGTFHDGPTGTAKRIAMIGLRPWKIPSLQVPGTSNDQRICLK